MPPEHVHFHRVAGLYPRHSLPVSCTSVFSLVCRSGGNILVPSPGFTTMLAYALPPRYNSSCYCSEEKTDLPPTQKPPLSNFSWCHRGSARPNKKLRCLHKLALYDRLQHCWQAHSSCARTFHALTITPTEIGTHERPTGEPSTGKCFRLAAYTRPTIIGGVSRKRKIII